MKNEFTLAFNEVIEDKQLPKEVILKAVESAMVSAYRRSVNASSAQHVEARINPDTGEIIIYAEKEVVEEVQDDRTEVSLQEALQQDPEAEFGMMIIVESTPSNFGRVAAQTARQVIQQRIRDAERQVQLEYYQKQIGEISSGGVQAINAQGLTIGLELRAEGTMLRKDMIPRERFRIHERVRALVSEIRDTPRGPQILLSRTHRDFLRRLLENEVPEIYHGLVDIRSIAREPGERAKVAVSATQSGIDPVGACVGIRGVRIQAIVRELHNEKIDVIEWNSDAAIFISKAISPARVVGVYLNENPRLGKTATVVVPEDQLSLAIGRAGQNARLAAKLTGWRIDIKSLSEATADASYKLQDPSLSALAEVESKHITQIESLLARKVEGRPLTPEEYDIMANFVDRIESATTIREQLEEAIIEDNFEELRKTIHASAFELDILDSNLPKKVANILQKAEYSTVGDLALQMKINSDDILRLQGIGPRAMEKISALIDSLESRVSEETEVVVQEPIIETEADKLELSTPESISKPIEDIISPTVELATTSKVSDISISEEMKPEQVPTADKPTKQEEEPEEDIPFEELFKLQPNMVKIDTSNEEGEEKLMKDDQKPKKKKRKGVEVEYDPDRDLILRKKKHKRSSSDWDWDL